MLPRSKLTRAPFELSPDATYVPCPDAAFRPDAFALVVDGRCMVPMYRPGDLVVCWPLASHREAEQGHPCALLLAGGHRVLKLVYHEPEHPDRLVLRCRNRDEFPQDLIVHVDDVVSIARAVWKAGKTD